MHTNVLFLIKNQFLATNTSTELFSSNILTVFLELLIHGSQAFHKSQVYKNFFLLAELKKKTLRTLMNFE